MHDEVLRISFALARTSYLGSRVNGLGFWRILEYGFRLEDRNGKTGGTHRGTIERGLNLGSTNLGD